MSNCSAVVRSSAVHFAFKHAKMAALPLPQKQLKSVRLGQLAKVQLTIQASGVCALMTVAARTIAVKEKYFIFEF